MRQRGSFAAPIFSFAHERRRNFAYTARSHSANLDRAFLDHLATEIGMDGVVEMIGIFMADAPERMAAIRRGIAESAVQSVRREAHALAGAASNVGLTRLTDAARALQHATERATDIDPSAMEEVAAALGEAMPLAAEWATARS